MPLFRRASNLTQPPGDLEAQARFERLTSDPACQAVTARMQRWTNTDEVWEEFTTLISGTTADMVREQGTTAGFNFSKRYESFVNSQTRFDLIVDGCVRCAGMGWAIEAAYGSLAG